MVMPGDNVTCTFELLSPGEWIHYTAVIVLLDARCSKPATPLSVRLGLVS